LRLVALDAELRGLVRPFADAIRAGVDALGVSKRDRPAGRLGWVRHIGYASDAAPRSPSTENG